MPVNHGTLLGCQLFKGYDLIYCKIRGLLVQLLAQTQYQSVQCPLAVHISHLMEVCTEDSLGNIKYGCGTGCVTLLSLPVAFILISLELKSKLMFPYNMQLYFQGVCNNVMMYIDFILVGSCQVSY